MTREKFTDLTAFLAHVSQSPKHGNNSAKGSLKFTGTSSFQEAMKLAREGWPDGLQRIQKARTLLEIPTAQNAHQICPEFAEEGDEIAVDRWIDGESDHFIAFPQRPTPARGKIAKIRVCISASASFDADQIMNRGARIAALIDAMESANIRCEVTAFEAIKEKDAQAVGEVTIKRAEDPLELDRLAFCLVHPSFLRRLFFRWTELLPNAEVYTANGGYGTPSDDRTDNPDEIYFGCLRSPKGAEEEIEKSIASARRWIEEAQ